MYERRLGEVAEWSNAAVLKTVEPLRVPGVRIPPSPPGLNISKKLESNKFIQLRAIFGALQDSLTEFCCTICCTKGF